MATLLHHLAQVSPFLRATYRSLDLNASTICKAACFICDLLSELSCRRDDQRQRARATRTVARSTASELSLSELGMTLEDSLKDWEKEGDGLAGTCLSLSENVNAGDCFVDSETLDLGHCL